VTQPNAAVREGKRETSTDHSLASVGGSRVVGGQGVSCVVEMDTDEELTC